MRWERLFDDLEGQLQADDARELAAEVADRTRRERALLGLHERLVAVVGGAAIEVRVAGVGVQRGVVTGVGPDWVLLDRRREQVGAAAAMGPQGRPDPQPQERPVLVAFTAVRAVSGLAGAEWAGAVAKGFGLGAALRAVSRDRAVVDVVDVEGTAVTGTIDAVGQDLVEVAEHSADLARRAENVLAVRSLPFWSLAVVRRR